VCQLDFKNNWIIVTLGMFVKILVLESSRKDQKVLEGLKTKLEQKISERSKSFEKVQGYSRKFYMKSILILTS
jgi:hypothetical protein